MKKFLLLLLALGLFSGITAQQSSFLTNGPIKENIPVMSGEIFSFYLKPLQQDYFPEEIRLRWVDESGDASAWHEFKRDTHGDEDQYISRLGFMETGKWTGFELEMPANGPVTLYFYDPGKSPVSHEAEPKVLESAACFQPEILDRDGWCPAGNCPGDPTPVFTNVTHLIVHHSAGSNSSADWAGSVRAIWDFHVNGRGWDDIGYNYLVDPNGVIYEGRGNDLQGAHYCAKNGGTQGYCLLGDFTDQLPTAAALDALTELLSWKCAESDINPLETSLHVYGNGQENQINLAGHTDGCGTECPGNTFYATFSNFRQGVAADLLNCLTSSATERPVWAESILVSPNPGSGAVRISGIPRTGELTLFTLEGRRLAQVGSDGLANIEAMLTEAAPGVYFLRTEADGEQYTLKVIRQ